jgi:hypothetical protein
MDERDNPSSTPSAENGGSPEAAGASSAPNNPAGGNESKFLPGRRHRRRGFRRFSRSDIEEIVALARRCIDAIPLLFNLPPGTSGISVSMDGIEYLPMVEEDVVTDYRYDSHVFGARIQIP